MAGELDSAVRSGIALTENDDGLACEDFWSVGARNMSVGPSLKDR
jgi:hypothetical protein